MADISERLTSRIEAGAIKRLAYQTEVVRADGGHEQRNQTWTLPLAEWDITIPPMKRSSADYAAAVALFHAAKGSALSFDFHDIETCADLEVRIKDDSLVFTGQGNLASIDLTLVQVRL